MGNEWKMVELSALLYEQFAKADELEATIRKNLEALGYGMMNPILLSCLYSFHRFRVSSLVS